MDLTCRPVLCSIAAVAVTFLAGTRPTRTSAGQRTAAVPAYTLQDLGTLGDSWSRANAVSAAGQVVGVSETADGREHAFLWERGKMRDLGTVGGFRSEATGINASGQVVGWAQTADGRSHAFLWSAGVMRDLGTMGADESEAYAINDAGQVVGDVRMFRGVTTAFLWTQGSMQDLGTLAGRDRRDGLAAVARGINASGQVVGFSSIAGVPTSHAFLWTRGVMQDLGTFWWTEDAIPYLKAHFDPPFSGSAAFGINAAGQVVGICSL